MMTNSTFYFAEKYYHSVIKSVSDNNASGQVQLVSYSLQCSIISTGNMISQKLTPPLKGYLCFQNYIRSARASQCAKSRAVSKVADYFFILNNLNKIFQSKISNTIRSAKTEYDRHRI